MNTLRRQNEKLIISRATKYADALHSVSNEQLLVSPASPRSVGGWGWGSEHLLAIHETRCCAHTLGGGGEGRGSLGRLACTTPCPSVPVKVLPARQTPPNELPLRHSPPSRRGSSVEDAGRLFFVLSIPHFSFCHTPSCAPALTHHYSLICPPGV